MGGSASSAIASATPTACCVSRRTAERICLRCAADLRFVLSVAVFLSMVPMIAAFLAGS